MASSGDPDRNIQLKQLVQSLAEKGDLQAIQSVLQLANDAGILLGTSKCSLHGRVHEKETRRALSNILVMAYWVNLDNLGSQPWYSHIDDAHVVVAARSALSDRSGTFAFTVDVRHALGSRPAIAIMASLPDCEGDPSAVVYRMFMPRPVGEAETFLISVPSERLAGRDDLPSEASVEMEFFDHESKRLEAAKEWLKKDENVRFKKESEIRGKAKSALKKFKPSTLPTTFRAHKNYLGDRKDLEKVMMRTQVSDLERLPIGRRTKSRRVVLPQGILNELKSTEGSSAVEIDAAKLALRITDTATAPALAAIFAIKDKTRGVEDKIIEQLLGRLNEKSRKKTKSHNAEAKEKTRKGAARANKPK